MFKQKFKVWDDANQRWANQRWAEEKFALLQDGNLVNLKTLEVKYRETHIPCFFTGFCASGKEIYTGDIVDYDYELYPIEVKHCRSVLVYGLDKAKIIGNVFEHPERLVNNG